MSLVSDFAPFLNEDVSPFSDWILGYWRPTQKAPKPIPVMSAIERPRFPVNQAKRRRGDAGVCTSAEWRLGGCSPGATKSGEAISDTSAIVAARIDSAIRGSNVGR